MLKAEVSTETSVNFYRAKLRHIPKYILYTINLSNKLWHQMKVSCQTHPSAVLREHTPPSAPPSTPYLIVGTSGP